jgi:hypothetical protein
MAISGRRRSNRISKSLFTIAAYIALRRNPLSPDDAAQVRACASVPVNKFR